METENSVKKNEQLPLESTTVSTYQLNKDYFKLFQFLCAEKEIACYVDYQFQAHIGKYPPSRDICKAKRRSQFDISFGSRGIEYGSISTFERNKGNEFDLFKIECERMNLEFILP